MPDISYIQIQRVPNQEFSISLDGKECEINLYLRYRYMYMDLKINGEYVFKGVICRNKTNVLQYAKNKLNGQLYFFDANGDEDPYYSDFCNRWWLIYVQ